VQVWKPHPYQLRAIAQCVQQPEGASALFLDPGLGKTSCSYGALAVLKQHGMFKRALVLAPRRPMLTTWPNERAKWSQFEGFTLSTAYGDADARRAALEADSDIVLSHYDLLASRGKVVGLVEMIEKLAEQRGEFPFDVLILDESTKIKNHATERFKSLRRIANRFTRRILLTGTPAPNGLHDLFGQITICDGGARLGHTVTKFRREFFRETYKPGVPVALWEPQDDAEDRIFAKIGDIALRMDAKDYLEMPGLLFNSVPVPLDRASIDTYKRVERDFIAKIGEGTITAANAAAFAMKLRQIASGTVYTDNGAEAIHNGKFEALLDLIEEQSGQPLLVAVAFRSEAERLQAFLLDAGFGEVPSIMGGISDAEAVRLERAWNAGELPILIAHPTTVAHGLNLQGGGSAVCWFSLTWSLEEFLQFNARVWRQGQKAKTCVIHMLCAQGTIDEQIAAVLTDKDATQKRLFDTLKELQQ
jgi:SNF2 family DNA or RNA helicase